jgi:hypothetical protein
MKIDVYLYSTKKFKTMNREEKLLGIVNEVIVERLTQLIEEMSDNEFVEMISDMYHDQTGEDLDDGTDDEFDQHEYVSGIVGSRVVPLLHKVCEWGIGKNIPTE